ncbi:hypothetical protein I551_6841 [Mycobacterium ulcerans str. Harvey]|uniref:Uncharacterized protein n=1 Tax=Mycobacterium ulcerans str. Harvey TaxID=1299332 RepID=A0ABP3A5C1_MYCUL|nr:hypothetical protein I551_6841 [Mycobacterium ulcerans str. Harvey]
MACGEDKGVVVFFGVLDQNLFGDHRGGRRKIDVIRVVLGDAVAGYDQ